MTGQIPVFPGDNPRFSGVYDPPMNPLVGVVMGSKSDWETMRHCCETLERLGVAHERQVMSAHRTPDVVGDYARSARDRGLGVLIAAAGGSAALAGVVAAHTTLPVLGVPIAAWSLDGLDSLLSTVQMPPGVPVGSLAIGKPGAINAAILATSILAGAHPELRHALERDRAERAQKVLDNPDPAS